MSENDVRVASPHAANLLFIRDVPIATLTPGELRSAGAERIVRRAI